MADAMIIVIPFADCATENAWWLTNIDPEGGDAFTGWLQTDTGKVSWVGIQPVDQTQADLLTAHFTGKTYAPNPAAVMTAVGMTLPPGPAGSTWYQGSAAPDDGAGVNGDYYYRTATGDIFTKAAGTWGSAVGNITGATGATGPQGPAGVGDVIKSGSLISGNVAEWDGTDGHLKDSGVSLGDILTILESI